MTQRLPKSWRPAPPPLVYVVDDEPLLLEAAEAALQTMGYRVRKFASPQAALRSLRRAKLKPALLLSDYAMGRMNGLELIARCKRVHPRLRCILVSGTAGPEVLREACVPVEQFLGKPYQAEQLCALAREVLQRAPAPGRRRAGAALGGKAPRRQR